MARLDGKVVLVTGASGAVGCALVEAISRAGGSAIATDLIGRDGIAHVLDVTTEDDWRRVIAAVDRDVGRLDALVNVAGVATLATIEETDLATWRRILAVNLDGTFLGCKHALALLRRHGGTIVNVASVLGVVAAHNAVAYCASKGGIRLLTKSVALLGARDDPPVRCNCILPNFLEGPLVDAVARQTNFPQAAMARMADNPLGRLGLPREVADLCVYLLSDQARFVTGAEFVIDGGLSAG